MAEAGGSGTEIQEHLASPPADVEAPDPRFSSGIPPGQMRDPESFVRMSGLVRTRRAGATGAREPAALRRLAVESPSGPVQGARTPGIVPRSALAESAAREEMTALLALQRLESNSRLLEAEQLLETLEKQPRDAPGTPAARRAPLLPKGIMIGRREKRNTLPLAVTSQDVAKRTRPHWARLVRLLAAGIFFAVVCWVLAYSLIGFVRRSVLPDLLDTWSPGASSVLPESSGGGGPQPQPGPVPQVREEIARPAAP